MPGLRPAPGNLKPASRSYDATPRGGPEKTSRQFLPGVLSGGVINMTGSIYFDVHSNTRGTCIGSLDDTLAQRLNSLQSGRRAR